MATSPQAFYCLWQGEAIRERLFELLSNEDICALRLANTACCNLVTKRLFMRTHLTFTANSFTRPSRIEALSRIGHHVEHLTFYFPHSNATFLPPLIHPESGQEISFLYSPHTSVESSLSRPKYGNPELGEILTQQYPPLFHAATHVSSFINAMRQMPNMRHLTIKTPGQDPRERYRRNIVDYALISLRISIERAPLTKLSKLSLSGVHPSALNYLRHTSGFGTSPSAALRWRQIRKLYISVESWDFYGPSPGLDHLKVIDDYIRAFAPQLEKFSFTWLGRRGPCPIALSDDPLFAPPRNSRKLFNEVTSPMSPLPPRPYRRPLVMPRLRSMAVRNATMNVQQVQGLIVNHKDTVREFDFENVALIRSGSWDEALAPLTDDDHSDAWSRRSLGCSDSVSTTSRSRSNSSGSAVSSFEDEEIPTPSAAAEAASRELFEVDLDGMLFGGVNDVEAFEASVENWAQEVTAVAAARGGSRPNSAAAKEEDDGGLASDIEAARLASEGFTTFTTKLKKRRVRRKSRKDDEDVNTAERQEESRYEDGRSGHRSSHRSHRSRSGHSHSRSDDTSDRRESRDSHRRRRRHRRHTSESTPETRSIPEVVGTDDEAFYNNRQPSTPPRPELNVSVPILNTEPFPVMLQPTVYDPSAKCGRSSAEASSSSSSSSPSSSPSYDDGLSPTQRSIEADLLAEAEEAAARSSALKRAKEAVITKLSREFARQQRRENGRGGSKDSAAVVAAGMSVLSLGMELPASHHHHHYQQQQQQQHQYHHSGLSCSSSIGFRIREGLFGRSTANVAAAVTPDHRSLESQSALVPLILSRS
ncbi:hypothetical protein VTK26DRAFT_7483 [Humicola hyalothermophila]